MVGLAVLGLGTWAQAQCSKDTDCKGDRVCDAGQCTAPAAIAAPAVSAVPSAEPSPAPPAAAPPPVQLAPVQQVAPLASSPLAPTDRPMRRRSTPLMATGIVMTAAAPVVWLAGLVLVATAQANCLSNAGFASSSYYSVQAEELNRCRDRATSQSYAVLLGGVVLVGVGIPLIVYGAKKVPDASLTASVAPWLAPGQGGLQLRVDL